MASNDDDDVIRCPVEWDRPVGSFCKPHRCELDQFHDGPHKCDCGMTRRVMFRDEPERFEREDAAAGNERAAARG